MHRRSAPATLGPAKSPEAHQGLRESAALLGPRTLSSARQKIAPRDCAEQMVIVVYFIVPAKYRSFAMTNCSKPDFIDSIRACLALFAPSALIRESPAAFPCFAVSVRPATTRSLKSPDISADGTPTCPRTCYHLLLPRANQPCNSMRQPRFERGTFGSGGRRSIQLSYWRASLRPR
jgi:hypothetical protein